MGAVLASLALGGITYAPHRLGQRRRVVDRGRPGPEIAAGAFLVL